MPSLTRVTPPRDSFKYTEDWDISSGRVIPLSLTDVGKLEKYKVILHNPHAHVRNKNDWVLLASMIIELRVDNSCCNDPDFTTLDLSWFDQLRSIDTGCYSFKNVEVVSIIGLPNLESVLVGEHSFTKKKFGTKCDPNRRFYLMNCPKMKDLTIHKYCFSDYSVCEINHLPSLDVISMGGISESDIDSFSFYATPSLVLKSFVSWEQSLTDLPLLKALIFGSFCFFACNRVVFESTLVPRSLT